MNALTFAELRSCAIALLRHGARVTTVKGLTGLSLNKTRDLSALVWNVRPKSGQTPKSLHFVEEAATQMEVTTFIEHFLEELRIEHERKGGELPASIRGIIAAHPRYSVLPQSVAKAYSRLVEFGLEQPLDINRAVLLISALLAKPTKLQRAKCDMCHLSLFTLASTAPVGFRCSVCSPRRRPSKA
jgi:hypothetical protein